MRVRNGLMTGMALIALAGALSVMSAALITGQGRGQTAEQEQGRGGQRPSTSRVDPEREVDDDPRAARERQDREDQPDEGRVDREARGDAAAHSRDHAILTAALEQRRSPFSLRGRRRSSPARLGRRSHSGRENRS